MTSAHTPGPWEVHNDVTFHNPYRIVAAQGELIANFNVKADKAIAQANADLIAAAPELLEACKTMLIVLEEDGYKQGAMELWKVLIAKAEGSLSSAA